MPASRGGFSLRSAYAPSAASQFDRQVILAHVDAVSTCKTRDVRTIINQENAACPPDAICDLHAGFEEPTRRAALVAVLNQHHTRLEQDFRHLNGCQTTRLGGVDYGIETREWKSHSRISRGHGSGDCESQ